MKGILAVLSIFLAWACGFIASCGATVTLVGLILGLAEIASWKCFVVGLWMLGGGAVGFVFFFILVALCGASLTKN